MSKWLSVELSVLLLVSVVAFAGFVSMTDSGSESSDYSDDSNDVTGNFRLPWKKPKPVYRPPVYVPPPRPPVYNVSNQTARIQPVSNYSTGLIPDPNFWNGTNWAPRKLCGNTYC